MKLSSFSLESGDTIYYHSHTNSIFNAEFEAINMPQPQLDEWYIEEAANHGVLTKTNKPIALRILLGHACNYDCVYCMQKDIGNPFERSRNTNIDNFIKTIQDKLDTTNLHRVELWGGEPFLYWKDMVVIMEHFDNRNIEFFISTNGSAFVQKHVDFFATLAGRVLINLSHDAVRQETLRGVDVLKNPKKVDIIKKMMQLKNVAVGVGCVVSAANYDLFEINKYFKDFADANSIDNLKITFIPAKNYDSTDSHNSANYVIRGNDLIAFNTIMKSFIEGCMSDSETYLRNNILYSPEGVFSYATFLKSKAPVTFTSSCGADSNDVLSVDLQNNVRLCPHTDASSISGTLDNLKDVKIKNLDLNRRITHCANCPVKRICRSSCPIKFPDAVFYSNCAFEKVWWGNIQEAAFSFLFGQSVQHCADNINIT